MSKPPKKEGYNHPHRIIIRERERWFKYYNILKNNHLVNFLIIFGTRTKIRELYDLKNLEMFLLVIIHLYRNKAGITTYKDIIKVLEVVAKYDHAGISHDLQRLVRLEYITKSKLGHYSLTQKGVGTVSSFQKYFYRAYEELNSILPDTN